MRVQAHGGTFQLANSSCEETVRRHIPMADLSSNPLGILSVTAAAALALAACAPNDTEQTTDDGAAEVQDSPTPEESPTAEESPTDAATEDTATDEATDDAATGATGDHPVYQAIDAALAEYPDGVVTEFEDNTDDDGYVEVFVYDGQTEWELEIDSQSFEIIDSEDDGIDGDDRDEAEAVEIEIAEAIQTAESEGGAEPYQGELDTEDGTVVWEIELTNGTEIYVDVATGDVVRTSD